MTPEQIDRLAEAAYIAWCDAQDAYPRPWRGRDALPEHRKEVWRQTVTTVCRTVERMARDAAAKDKATQATFAAADVFARKVARSTDAPERERPVVLTKPLMERWHQRSRELAERREPETA